MHSIFFTIMSVAISSSHGSRYMIFDTLALTTEMSEESLFSGITLECRPKECKFDTTLHQLKSLKIYYTCTGSSQEKNPRVSVQYNGHVNEPCLSCVVGA